MSFPAQRARVPRFCLAIPLIALSVFAGCAASPKTSAKPADAKESEYIYYTPTGSNIPVRIRKDQLQASDAETSGDQEAIRNLQRKGQRQPKGN